MFDFSMLSYDQTYFSLLQDDYIPYPRIEDVSPWTHTHTHTPDRQILLNTQQFKLNIKNQA